MESGEPKPRKLKATVESGEPKPRKRKATVESVTEESMKRNPSVESARESEEPKAKKNCRKKAMNKKTREALQTSIKSIDTSVLVGEVVTALKEQCFDCSLTPFVGEFCEAKQLMSELVEYHRDILLSFIRIARKRRILKFVFK